MAMRVTRISDKRPSTGIIRTNCVTSPFPWFGAVLATGIYIFRTQHEASSKTKLRGSAILEAKTNDGYLTLVTSECELVGVAIRHAEQIGIICHRRSRVRRQDRIKPERGQRDERGFESAHMLSHPTISHAQQGWRPSRVAELEKMLAASLP